MSLWAEKDELLLKWWVIVSGYMLVASLVTHVTLSDPGFHFHDPDSPVAFGKMVYGDAQKPFVFRALVPLAIRFLTSLTPETVQSALTDFWDDRPALRQYGYVGKLATEYSWGLIIIYLSLIGFGLCIRQLILVFYRLSFLASYLFSILAVASVVLLRSYFVYDYPNLLLFTICMSMMIRGNWALYYAVFLFACFNKETAVLLPFILWLNRPQIGNRKIALTHVSVQFGVWLGVAVLLRSVFWDRPGGILEFHLLDYNLPLFTKPLEFFRFGFNLLPRGFNVLLVGSVTALVLYRWSAKPLFLRRSLWILAPLIGLAFLFGWVDEIRMYYEALPIVFCLSVHSIAAILSEPVDSQPGIT